MEPCCLCIQGLQSADLHFDVELWNKAFFEHWPLSTDGLKSIALSLTLQTTYLSYSPVSPGISKASTPHSLLCVAASMEKKKDFFLSLSLSFQEMKIVNGWLFYSETREQTKETQNQTQLTTSLSLLSLRIIILCIWSRIVVTFSWLHIPL